MQNIIGNNKFSREFFNTNDDDNDNLNDDDKSPSLHREGRGGSLTPLYHPWHPLNKGARPVFIGVLHPYTLETEKSYIINLKTPPCGSFINVYCAIFITSSSVNLPENTINVSSSLSSICMTTADCCLAI